MDSFARPLKNEHCDNKTGNACQNVYSQVYPSILSHGK